MESRNQEQIAQLPIPGGWKSETVQVGPHSWRLLLPADPDAFILQATSEDEWPDPYWARLWPAARTLAELLLAQDWPAETNILELGCGNGFVGLAAATRGWRVTFSDYVPLAVELSLANARGNHCLKVAGEVIDWRDPTGEQSFERILACDCVYDPELHQPLLQTIRARLKPGGLVWLGDPGRVGMAESFVRWAREQEWQVALYDESHALQNEFARGEFRLIKMWRTVESA
jgi:predicted nicotinamide N-methyase